jgi:hypothetical protein
VKRPTWGQLAAGVVLIAAVALATLVGVFGRGWWRGEAGTYAPSSPLTSTRLEPASSLFGDELTARAGILIDAESVDPRTVRVQASFRPYRIVSTRRQVSDDIGRATRVDYTFRLQCLTLACLAAIEREGGNGRVRVTPIRFAPARVVARTRDGMPATSELGWPRALVRSRLTPAEIAAGEVRRSAFTASPVSYSISPHLLGGSLLALAMLLTLGGGYLIASALLGEPRLAGRLRRRARLTPLERALALVRDATENGDTTAGRKALERLAAELRREGDHARAAAAGRLAWSEQRPTREAVQELTSGLGSTNGR